MRLVWVAAVLVLVSMATSAQEVELEVESVAAPSVPLVRYADSGDLAAVRGEIQRGNDVNKPLENGITAAHLAARGGHLAVLQEVAQIPPYAWCTCTCCC